MNTLKNIFGKKDENSILQPFLDNNKLHDCSEYFSKFKDEPSFGSEIDAIFDIVGGKITDNGELKIFTRAAANHWLIEVNSSFPDKAGKLLPIAMDWMGRLHAMGANDLSGNMFMLDPDEGEAYKMQQTLVGFFNEEMVEYKSDTLDPHRFNELLEYFSLKTLPIDKVIAFKVPLALGGEQTNENRELTDLEVNWSINMQIHQQTSK